MGKEIERKFLADISFMSYGVTAGHRLRQAYLSVRPEATVRVRIADSRATLTIKGITSGATRSEWEYAIPTDDAVRMIDECSCGNVIDKTRYIAGRWEIDVFHGALEGLILAEIELDSEDEQVELPEFIIREVTHDKRYYNSMLSSCETPPPIR